MAGYIDKNKNACIIKRPSERVTNDVPGAIGAQIQHKNHGALGIETTKPKDAARRSNKHIVIDCDSSPSSPTCSPSSSDDDGAMALLHGQAESLKARRPIKPPQIAIEPRISSATEIFCGCGRLTEELKKAGFEAQGVDYFGNKDKPRTKTAQLDITTEWGFAKP
jgi:hypothetical protein